MIELESKVACPHCGASLHRKPYLMASHPDVQPPAWSRYAAVLLVFLVAYGLFQLLGA